MRRFAAAIFEAPDAAQQLADLVAGQPILDGDETVGVSLDLGEVGLGDRCVVSVGAYSLARSLKVEVCPTLARCSVFNPSVETFRPLGYFNYSRPVAC